MSYYGSARYQGSRGAIETGFRGAAGKPGVAVHACPELSVDRAIRGGHGGSQVSAHEGPGFRPRSRAVRRGAGCGRPNGLRYRGVRSGRESTHCPAGGPLRAGVPLLETAALRGSRPRVSGGVEESAAARASLGLPGRCGNAPGARRGRGRNSSSERWPWMRICGSLISISASCWPRRTIPAAPREHFQEAIRIDPSKPDAHYRLGRLWSSLGRDEEAQAEFEQVKKLAAEEPPPPLIRLPGRKLP